VYHIDIPFLPNMGEEWCSFFENTLGFWRAAARLYGSSRDVVAIRSAMLRAKAFN